MQKCEGILDRLFQDIGAKLAEGYFLRYLDTSIYNRFKLLFVHGLFNLGQKEVMSLLLWWKG